MCKEKEFYTRGYGVKRAWKKYYGELPAKGLEIHHKDGNPYNNEKDNLEALTPKEHDQRHTILNMRRNYRQINNRLMNMEKERQRHLEELNPYRKTKGFYKSPAGYHGTSS